MSSDDWKSWPLAQKILDAGAQDGNSLLIAAPTGTGKSFTTTKLVLGLIRRPEATGRVSFYLVPLKALAEEIYDRFKEEMTKEGMDTFGLAIATGDYEDPVDLDSSTLVVATYEKLLSMIKAGVEFRLYVIVADEFQIVADSSRGPRIEALMSLHFGGSNAVLFVLSAVIGNPEAIAHWLGVVPVKGDKGDRKVPLDIKPKWARDPSEFVLVQVKSELAADKKTRARRDKLRYYALACVSEVLKPTAREEFERFVSAQTNRRRRPRINHNGRVSKKTRRRMRLFFDRFYHSLDTSNQIYVFWHQRKCVYVGQTKRDVRGGSGKWRPNVWRASTHLQMFATATKRDLDKLECLAVDRWTPSLNKVKPPSTYYRSKCPVHRILRDVDREMKQTFVLRS